MAVRSRDFVGIAEGIRNHELSTKSQIENLKGHMSELSGRRSSLNSIISYLEAAIAAAYEDTDEDGDPDYGLIASLEAEKSSAENELLGVEQDLDSTGSELESKQSELEAVEEEKAQTLFEIQERARKTSQNISLAGGMYGAYAGVGGTLQNSLQTSLSSLTQAAGILGDSVDGASGERLSGSSSGVGNTASGEIGTNGGNGNTETGALAAFTGGYSGEALPLSASQFSTSQDQLSTPATMPNYHSGQGSINTKAPQNFSTEQGSNNYAVNSFSTQESEQPSVQLGEYISSQTTSDSQRAFSSTNQIQKSSGSEIDDNLDNDDMIFSLFGKKDPASTEPSKTPSSRSDLEKKRAWAEQYKVDVAPTHITANAGGSSSETTAKGQRQREIGHETEMEIDDIAISSFIATILGKKQHSVESPSTNAAANKTEYDIHREWKKQYEVSVNPITPKTSTGSGMTGDPLIGQRQRELAHETELELGSGSLGVVAAVEQFFARKHSADNKYETITSHSTNIRNQILVAKLNPIAVKNNWPIKSTTSTLAEDLRAVNPNFYSKDGTITADDRWTRNCQRCVIAFEARCRGMDVQATERILDGTDTLPMMNHPTGWLSAFKNPSPVNCKNSSGLATGETVQTIMSSWGDGARAIVRIQRCDTIKIRDAKGQVKAYAVETVNGKTVVCDIVSRKEVDISTLYPNADFSEGIEIRKSQNPQNPKLNDYVLYSKKSNTPLSLVEKHGGHVFSAIQHKGKTVFCDAQTGEIIHNHEKYFLLAKREETYVVRIDNLELTDRAKDCCKPVKHSLDKSYESNTINTVPSSTLTSKTERGPPQS